MMKINIEKSIFNQSQKQSTLFLILDEGFESKA